MTIVNHECYSVCISHGFDMNFNQILTVVKRVVGPRLRCVFINSEVIRTRLHEGNFVE